MKGVMKMQKTAKDMMKEICQLSLQNEFKRIAKLNISNIKYQSLSTGQIEQLARKIALLPSEYRNILFFHYCFNSNPNETDKMLETENTINKLPYIQKMLSSLMGLEDLWIDEGSMKKASQIVLKEMTKDYENLKVQGRPDYSKEFRRKLKTITIKGNPNSIFMQMAKRVAVFILVCILSISAVLVVSVEAREKMLGWIIQVYPRFSIFTLQNTNDDNDLVKLSDLKINYVPQGFELVDTHEGRTMLIYNYISEKNEELTIKFLDPSGEGKSYYDTESAKVKEIKFKDAKAYTWETDALTCFIWYQDGVECHISGNLNQDKIIKVADGISK